MILNKLSRGSGQITGAARLRLRFHFDVDSSAADFGSYGIAKEGENLIQRGHNLEGIFLPRQPRLSAIEPTTNIYMG